MTGSVALRARHLNQTRITIPSHHETEVGFAAEYLLQNEDFIPDQTPRVGLTDDHAILERVFERNRYELRSFGASAL